MWISATSVLFTVGFTLVAFALVAHVVDARRLVELLLRPAAWVLVAGFVLATTARACSSTSSAVGRTAPAPAATVPMQTVAVAHDGVRANVHADLLFPFVLGHLSLAIYLYRRANPPFRDPRVRGRVRRPAPVPERDGRAP